MVRLMQLVHITLDPEPGGRSQKLYISILWSGANPLIPAQSSQFRFNVYPNLDTPHGSLSRDVYNRGINWFAFQGQYSEDTFVQRSTFASG
jgi:hypothetical protein